MSDNVTRYSISFGIGDIMREAPSGPWVKYDNLPCLLAENAQLRAERDKLKEYAKHRYLCNPNFCTCGLNTLLTCGLEQTMTNLITPYPRTPTRPRKVAKRKMVSDDQMRSLLVDCRIALRAINASPAHAASWIEPKTNAVTVLVRRIERFLKELPSPAPARKVRRAR